MFKERNTRIKLKDYINFILFEKDKSIKYIYIIIFSILFYNIIFYSAFLLSLYIYFFNSKINAIFHYGTSTSIVTL